MIKAGKKTIAWSNIRAELILEAKPRSELRAITNRIIRRRSELN